MKDSCAVVYISSRVDNVRHPQLDAILADLSRIMIVTLVGRGIPRSSNLRRDYIRWREFIVPTPVIKAPKDIMLPLTFLALAIELRRALNEIRPKIIYAVNLDALAALGPNIIRQRPTIYHALEIFSQAEGIIYQPIWEMMERFFNKNIDMLIVPSHARADYYGKKYGTHKRTNIWLNAPSIDAIEALAINLPSKVKKSNGAIELIYPGQLGKNRDLVPVIKALRILRQRNIECRLTILSADNEYYHNILHVAAINNEVSDLLNNEPYLENRTDLIKRIAQSSYLIARYSSTSTNDRLCAPTKLVDALLAGVSWIGDDVDGTRAWNSEFGGGVLCDLEDPGAFAHCISDEHAMVYKVTAENLISRQKAMLQELKAAIPE